MLCPTPTCLLPHKRKWDEWSHLLTSCPAPERSPTLSVLPGSTPSMRAQGTALAASALRRSSLAVSQTTHRCEQKSQALSSVSSKGCRAARRGWGDSALRSTPTAAQRPPSATSPLPPNPCVLSGAHLRGWLALELWLLNSPRRDGWRSNPLPLLWMETGLLAMRLGWKSICAAGNPTLERENWFNAEKVCSLKWNAFPVKIVQPQIWRQSPEPPPSVQTLCNPSCLLLPPRDLMSSCVFLSLYQRLLSEKASHICPFQQSENVSHHIFSAINIFMSSLISQWRMERGHSLGP